jgi:hypothetical protein
MGESVQGIQGLQGTSVQGMQGRQGLQGTSVQGMSGTSQGIQGLQGPQGTSVQGMSGTSQGIQGLQGPQGTSVQGMSGTSQGIQGLQGFQGLQGISVQGTSGAQGVTGTVISLPVTQIPNAADLNQYTTPGTYHQSLDAQAGAGTNYPIGKAGLLEVYASSAMVYQRYTVYDSGQIYTRSSYNSSWYAWRLELDSGNYNSYAPTLTGTGASGTWSIGAASVYDSNYRRITHPGGAEYVTQSSTITGAIQVTLPVGYTNTMMRMTIKVYNYLDNTSFDVICGGYNYAPGPSWVNTFAYILGDPDVDRRFNVRFGYTAGGKMCIYIGELASSWSYPQVFVTDVQLGYSGVSSTWVSGWSIGFQASAFENVTSTIGTTTQIGYATTTNVGNALVLRDASGNFSAGTITATSFSLSSDTNTKLVQHTGTNEGGGALYLRGEYPTMYFRDTTAGSNSAMIHVNGSTFHILTGPTDAGMNGWTVGNGQSYWPLTINLTNNDMTAGGGFWAVRDITAFASDERLKKNITQIENALEKVKSIRGVNYEHNELAVSYGLGNKKYVGVLAQEVEKVLPEVIALAPFDKQKEKEESRSGKNYKTVKYEKIVPLLIEAIKDLSIQADDMKQQIKELKEKS